MRRCRLPVFRWSNRRDAVVRFKARLTDKQGIPLAMAEPQTGNHADLHEIEEMIDEIVSQLSAADISADGLFCDLDAGFDAKALRSALSPMG